MSKIKNFIYNRFLVALAIAIIGIGSMLFNTPFVNVFILLFTSAIYVFLIDGFFSKPNKVERDFHNKMRKYLPIDMQDEI